MRQVAGNDKEAEASPVVWDLRVGNWQPWTNRKRSRAGRIQAALCIPVKREVAHDLSTGLTHH